MEKEGGKCVICGEDIGNMEEIHAEGICTDCYGLICLTQYDRIIPDQLPSL